MKQDAIDYLKVAGIVSFGWVMLAGAYLLGWTSRIFEFLLRLQFEMGVMGVESLVWPVMTLVGLATLVVILAGKFFFRAWWIVYMAAGVIFFLSVALFWVKFPEIALPGI